MRQMRQNFVMQCVHLLKCWLWDVQLGTVVEKNWSLSVDQYWLQVLQFLLHLIELLSICLRCNGFARIQKALVIRQAADHQTVTVTFLLQVWLWEVLWSSFSVQPLSWSSPAVLGNPLFIIHHNLINKWVVAVM